MGLVRIGIVFQKNSESIFLKNYSISGLDFLCDCYTILMSEKTNMEMNMDILDNTIGKRMGKIRNAVMGLAMAAAILLSQTIYAGSWVKQDPSLLGDLASWDSVAVSEDGQKIAASSYIYNSSSQQYENCYIYISEDGGSTWSQKDPAGSAGGKYLSAVAIDADGAKMVASANNDYVYTSSDSGTIWTKREPAGAGVTKPWLQVSISADGSKMAACSDETGYIYMSSDGGATWTTCDSAGSSNWSQVAWSADGTKVAASNNAFIYTSTDSGATWTKREPAGSGIEKNWSSIASSSDGSILLACDATSQSTEFKGFLWTSTDGGATWIKREPAGTDVQKTWREVSMSSDGTKMMACADSDFAYLSYDGGASWAKLDPVGNDTGSGWKSVSVSGDSLFVAACGSLGNLYTRSLIFDIADPFFTTQYLLPQTLNKKNLTHFLSMEHNEYHLDGWFFFGNLIEGRGAATADQISSFAISVQRKDIAQINGTPIRFAVFPSIVAFQGSRHDGYLFGGALDESSQVTVTSDPWSVVAVANGNHSIMSMSLEKGQMGMKNAVYHLAADVEDQEKHRLQTDLWIKDVFGVINDGYGPASFFPQWILPGQREKILDTYGGSLESYMFAENDPMVGQGDYYYSAPTLKILSFKITRDYTEILSEGKKGKLWMDYTVASYDDRASDMLNGCKWQFFAIQLTGDDSLLILNTETNTTGAMPVARLYRKKSKSLNGAINSTYSWDIDKIIITPDESSKWTSPVSKITYYTKYDIELRSDKKYMNSTLSVTMVRQDSEIYIPNQNPAYEGVGTVTGKIGSRKVKGYAFAEFEVDTGLKGGK